MQSTTTSLKSDQELKETLTEQHRKNECDHIKKNHPDMCPIILKRYEKSKNVKNLEYEKFLFLLNQPCLQVMLRIQKEVQAKKLWFFVYYNNKPKQIYPAAKICTLYRRYKNIDGNLYIYYTDVNIFPSMNRTMYIIQGFVALLAAFYIYAYFYGEENKTPSLTQ